MQPFHFVEPGYNNEASFMGPCEMDHVDFIPSKAIPCDTLSQGQSWIGRPPPPANAANLSARKGSIYQGLRNRETQATANFWGIDIPTAEDVAAQFYGDMAYRREGQSVNGLRPICTFRGMVNNGQDLGKPRRVSTRRNTQDRGSTGYGGIAFKRAVSMSRGEPAGLGLFPMPMMVPSEPCLEPGFPWEALEVEEEDPVGSVSVLEKAPQ